MRAAVGMSAVLSVDLHTAALDSTSWGFAILPLHHPVQRDGGLVCRCGNSACASPAKHPYARHAPRGLLDATRDPRQVERWWGAGVPYNIAIRTGEASGVVVIDVDPRHGGDETLAELENRFGALPQTWRFLTGGGGEHILFRHPGYRVQNGASSLGDGLDVRGDGGYIVGPGSRHISGRQYAVDVDHHPDDVELAELPHWLATMISAPAKSNGHFLAELPENWRKLVTEGVAEGRRNEAIARLAGHLLRKYVDPLVVLDLCRVWNACRCQPALDDAEIIRTVNSIASREIARRGAARHA
jgi:Bifunctional DNA primase/polymerase, N-terminal/Primase C terminal 1 (PriCT-1)